ncbi:hypothetical protein A2U01_0077101, partial [Trifolium medium]|nr:hypothetical protein [Trifolium medium]
LKMAEASEKYKLLDTITDPDLDWVGPEPRGIASVITPTAGGTHTTIEEGPVKNWDTYCPVAGNRACSRVDTL